MTSIASLSTKKPLEASSQETLFFKGCMQNQVASLLSGLQDLRKKRLYTDIILCACDEEFPCHKVVLAASSRYFNAMFLTPFSEQRTSRVNLKQISPWALRHLIDFAYTGYLSLSTTVVQDIFIAATLLDYPLAVDACIKFMEEHLHVSNCLGVQLLAETYDFPDLVKSARSIAVKNFSSLVSRDASTSGEWLRLPLNSVESYLSADDLEVRSEQDVLDACLAWVSHEPETRLTHLPSLLRLVRLHQLPSTILRTYICSPPLTLRESPAALLYIQQVVNRIEGAPDDSHVNGASFSADTLPRPSTLKRPTLVAIGGMSSGFILDSVDAFSFARGRCISCPALPADSLTWFSATVANNTLIITGGIRAGVVVPTVYRFSVEENRWTRGSEMPTSRARHASVSVQGGYVFVLGGVTVARAPDAATTSASAPPAGLGAHSLRQEEEEEEGEGNLPGTEVPSLVLVKSIDRYDVALDEWVNVGTARTPRQMSSIAVVFPQTTNDDCYLMAGRRREGASNFTLVELGGTLDVQSNVVTEKMAIYQIKSDLTVHSSADYIALMRPVRYAKCVTNQSGNLVYIFWEASGELSVLDFHRQSLRTLQSLSGTAGSTDASSVSHSAVHCGCAWVDGRLYVLGGFAKFLGAGERRPTAPRHSIHCYDPETNLW
ncbi:unnamed protein product [Mesocestoides corti]|nr:unnamed protein product [Mesocestoides corti]